MTSNHLRGQAVELAQEHRPNFQERLMLLRHILKYLFCLRRDLSKTEYIVLVQLYGDCLAPGYHLEQFEHPGYVLPSIHTLANFPEGSLGKSYSNYLYSLSADGKADITDFERLAKHIENPKAKVLRERFADKRREQRFAVTVAQHDLYHVLTNLKTERTDEFCLQAFTYGQIGNGGNFILTFFGVLGRLQSLDFFAARQILRSIQLGKQAKVLCTVNWEPLWAQPLAKVRSDLRIKSKNLE